MLEKIEQIPHNQRMNTYLDWASTTPISRLALSTYTDTAAEYVGNPSSIHDDGIRAGKLLERCRSELADLLQTIPGKLYFTSGGTESNHLVLASLLSGKRRGNIIISGIEHPAVYEYTRLYREHGFTVRILKTVHGFADLDHLAACIDTDTQCVACMLVNNVTGVIQPLDALVRVVREKEQRLGRRIHIHTDAVQALGKIPVMLPALGVDSAAFSAHKFRGPKGTGLLFLRTPIKTLVRGGGQERDVRSGTEALPAIASATAAASQAAASVAENLERARGLKVCLLGHLRRYPKLFTPVAADYLDTTRYSPYITTFSCNGIPSEVMVRVLNDAGYSISAGSACSSRNRTKRERVLKNMGFDSRFCASAVRISPDPGMDPQAFELFCETLCRQATLLHKSLGKI